MYYDSVTRARYEANLGKARRALMTAANCAADSADDHSNTDLTEMASHVVAMMERSLSGAKPGSARHPLRIGGTSGAQSSAQSGDKLAASKEQ